MPAGQREVAILAPVELVPVHNIKVPTQLGDSTELLRADLATFRWNCGSSTSLCPWCYWWLLRVKLQVVSPDHCYVDHVQVTVLAPVQLLLVEFFEVPLKSKSTLELLRADIAIKSLFCFGYLWLSYFIRVELQVVIPLKLCSGHDLVAVLAPVKPLLVNGLEVSSQLENST